jgi:hypothetical protein
MAYILSGERADVGSIRETFFLNQLKVYNNIYSTKKGDFMLDDMVFEIGGKNKTKKQLIDVPDAFVVKDEIEYGFGNTVPLWHFGLLY